MGKNKDDTSIDDKIKNMLHDVDYTSSNASEMSRRLQENYNISRFCIVEYNVFAIINSLLLKYFTGIKDFYAEIIDYSSIAFSLVALVASLFISVANYTERSNQAYLVLMKLKRIKKKIERLEAGNGQQINIIIQKNREEDTEDTIEQLEEKYNKIVSKLERRSEIDFFRTCRKDDFAYHNFSTAERLYYYLSIILRNITEFALYSLPIAFDLIVLWQAIQG